MEDKPEVVRLIQVTQELIERGQSWMGGWNREQLKLIGVPWPPLKGWRRRAVGRWITRGDADLFVNLRGVTLKRNKAYRRNAPLADLILNFDAEESQANPDSINQVAYPEY